MPNLPKKNKTSPLKKIGYPLFLCFALGAGAVYGWASQSKILVGAISSTIRNQDPREAFGNRDSETLLILGCDEDRFYHGILLHGQNIYKKYARSDMMLLTRLDFKHNMITGISIPRDTMVSLPGHGRHKINAFHEEAKPKEADEVTKEAVQQVIPGVEIDKVVDLDFDAIQKLVDIVGGVELDVPKAMNYDDNAGELHIHLKPGLQTLSGYNAMCFVRFRHDRESDFGRQRRQKDFLTAFKKSVFHNALKLPEIVDQGKACLNFALNDDELVALATFARKVPQENIQMGMVPTTENGNALEVDKRNLPSVLAKFGFGSDQYASVAGRQ